MKYRPEKDGRRKKVRPEKESGQRKKMARERKRPEKESGQRKKGAGYYFGSFGS
jgi:hypothetical protein